MSSVRKLAGMSAVAALCLAPAGCTSGGGPDTPSAEASPSPSTSAASSSEPVQLRFSVYGNDQQVESYVDLAKAFTKNNPNVTVALDRAPNSDAAMANLATRSDQGAPPDLFLMEHEDLPALIAEQRVYPVDDLLEDRQVDFGDGFQRGGLEAFSADSALQCMPHDVSPLVVYYNKDLLDLGALVEDEDDVPTAEDGWTWEEFAEAARQMSHGRVKGVYIEPSLHQLAPFIWSGGGELVDDPTAPTTLTLSDGDTMGALEQVLTLVRDPQVTPSRAELDRVGAVDRFKHGRIGMILGDRSLTPELRNAENLDFEVMPLPKLGPYRTITAMSGYCISAQTKHLQAAADFLAFAVGREGATITATGGYVVPSNLQVAHSPAFLQPGKDPHNAFVFNEGVRRAQRPPFVREWPEVTEEVRPLLEKLFYAPVLDLETLDTLLTQIDTTSQPILAPPTESPTPE
ncbi:MAG TPA: extracellular solute-binding protein [Nocardioidaceae bacterium]|nr:extracellular solute-binding protein [Nocardioidaceae bacterium]